MTMWAAIYDFIQRDFTSHRWRHVAEVLGALLSLVAAITIAIYTPVPPLIFCYTLWNMASLLLAGASYSRGSFGLFALYSGFLVIDTVGLIRTLLV